MRCAGMLLLTILVHPILHAQSVRVAASGSFSWCADFTIPSFPRLIWLNPDIEPRDDEVVIASGDDQRVLALSTDGSGIEIAEVFAHRAPQPFFSGLPGVEPAGMAVASTGRVFVLYRELTARSLAVISPSGVLEATYPLPADTLDEIAVLPDSCTVLYSREGSIGRINGCTGAPLADFPPLGEVRDIRPLPSGEVLVVLEHAIDVFTAQGVFVRRLVSLATAALPAGSVDEVAVFGGIAWLAASFISCGDGELVRISLADGSELSRVPFGLSHTNGLVVATGIGQVPASSPALLVLLAISLAIAGTFIAKLR